MDFQAKWIRPTSDMGDICPVFQKKWNTGKAVRKAELFLTALGVYEAKINGNRISDYVLAPGWTVYEKRLQYQQYDITDFLQDENVLTVTVGKGWLRSPMPGFSEFEEKKDWRMRQPAGIWGEIRVLYKDGTEEVLPTDASWLCGESPVRFSEIYDGETFDAQFVTGEWKPVGLFDWCGRRGEEEGSPAAKSTSADVFDEQRQDEVLILQEGEEIREMERVSAKSVFKTPKGELLVDFGQEVTGYVEFTVEAEGGEHIRILHGEVLDADGNFYNENYRIAKAEINYTCRSGVQTWHPVLTFFGFRYIKLENFPGVPGPEQFTAIAVYSNLKKTGELRCSDAELNQLFSNIFWGQKGNFLDVPTDCPQRDERLGWTGDAQVFVKTASYNYDVERFFGKWLRDMAAEQRADGGIGQVIPDYLPMGNPSAAWGDAATICPWQIYQTYGNAQILREQFPCMKKWVDYIKNATTTPYLWTGGEHFGDWLGLDAPSGSYKGSSREDFIASAFYAHSTELVVKAGKIIGEDVAEYETLYERIVQAFRANYPVYLTQTEHVLAVRFNLAENPQETADALAQMIQEDGCQMRTGFVGTPYILHVLSDYGHTDIAYSLLLRRKYPSWLYSVQKGATTIWEHWDGIMEDGSFWSKDMNSFNHYAYGSVADWVYEKAAGIQPVEENPGFAQAVIAPHPDSRLEWLEASIDTRHGKIRSRWTNLPEGVRYEITTPVPARIVIKEREMQVEPGSYTLWSE